MDTNTFATITKLTDGALLARLEELAAHARTATAELIAHLAELAHRKAHRGEGEGSLFKYCTQVLRLSQAAACNRIAAAYAARRYPIILDFLADGSVNLTTVRLLAPQLTDENHRAVLAEAIGKTKEEVLEIRARLAPQPDVRPTVRKLPGPPLISQSTASPLTPPAPPATDPLPAPPREPARPTVLPLSPERYGVHMTVDKETRDDLRVVQDLMRRAIPDGDPGKIFGRALKLLRADLEKKMFAATERPRTPRPAASDNRTIPAHVQRTVWTRDGGQCSFVGRRGPCSERAFLEFHHRQPHALGGEATVENITLRCRAHNQFAAEADFGTARSMR